MRRKTKKSVSCIALAVAACFLMNGCGGSSEVVPELIKPVAEVGYFMPVETVRIGDVRLLQGSVVPASYGQFYTTNTMISEICVKVGDYVEAGQVLAKADIKALTRQLTSLEADLDFENASWEHNKEIYRLSIRMSEISGGSTAVARENRDYDEQLHAWRVAKLEDAIDEYQELCEEGTLKANHSGYVTYVKDLGISTSCAVNENVVVIADDKERWIEADTTLDNYHYADYELKFLQYQGERVPVEELPYSSEEEILCQAGGSYPNVRFACPAQCDLAVGENCPLFFIRRDWEETPVVGKEALIRAEGNYYVYVQKESGKERRQVTIGERDQHLVQILDGLSPGEMVYYESSLLAPESYEELTVEKTDFTLINQSDAWEFSYAKTQVYQVPYDGTVEELFVEKGDSVEEGQLLYTLRTDIRSAALRDAKAAVEKENRSYEARDQEIGKQLDQAGGIPGEMGVAMRKMLRRQRELLELTHNHTLDRLQDNYDELSDNNDGDGLISVCAKDAGTVRLVEVRPGQKADIEVKAGLPLIVTTAGEPNGITFLLKDSDYVIVYPHFPAKLWSNISIEGRNLLSTSEKSGKSQDEVKEAEAVCLEVTGSCSSIESLEKKAQIPFVHTDEEDGPSLSYVLPSARQQDAFSVKLPEDFDWETVPGHLEASFACYALSDVILLPEKAIFREKDSTGISTGNYYVWLKKDGRLVQQFVLVDLDHAGYKQVPVLYGLQDGDVIASP